MTKRPFLLLEILIALSLVALCAIPLIVKPIRAYREEMANLEEVERERLADWTFSEIREKLYKNEISWEELPGLHARTDPFSLDEGAIQIPGVKDKEIKRLFTFYGQGEKEGVAGETLRMIYVYIEFKPSLSKKKKIYTYRAIVKRMPKETASSPLF